MPVPLANTVWVEQVISQFNVNKNFVQNIVHVFSVKHFFPCWQIRFVKISPLIVCCESIFCKSRLIFFIAFDVFYRFRLKYHYFFKHVFTIGIILSATERHSQRRRNSTNTFEMQLMERNVTLSRDQGIRKCFWPSRGGFSLFWSSVRLLKDDWEIIKEQCAGVWATFIRWYVNDLLKHYFIVVKKEKIFVM